METLDEKLERLYGPQKTKYCTSPFYCAVSEPRYIEIVQQYHGAPTLKEMKNVRRSHIGAKFAHATGEEMAEKLLGHPIDKDWYYEHSK